MSAPPQERGKKRLVEWGEDLIYRACAVFALESAACER
jgi:hypothetical protein